MNVAALVLYGCKYKWNNVRLIEHKKHHAHKQFRIFKIYLQGLSFQENF